MANPVRCSCGVPRKECECGPHKRYGPMTTITEEGITWTFLFKDGRVTKITSSCATPNLPPPLKEIDDTDGPVWHCEYQYTQTGELMNVDKLPDHDYHRQAYKSYVEKWGL